MATLKTTTIKGEKAVLFPLDTYDNIMKAIVKEKPEYTQKLLEFTRAVRIRHLKLFNDTSEIALTFTEVKKLKKISNTEFVI